MFYGFLGNQKAWRPIETGVAVTLAVGRPRSRMKFTSGPVLTAPASSACVLAQHSEVTLSKRHGLSEQFFFY